MTRQEVLAWLDERRPAPPPALREHLAAAVGDAPDPLPEHLARLGSALLAGVARRPAGGREVALDLLAADAFVTYAFEAQAEAAVTGLASLVAQIAAGERDAAAP